MSHGELREDKNCQNCGSIVEDRYCSHCGQENTETRQRFHFLITHFIEDFVHYDSSFWITIRNLFLKPGSLTKAYLSGKRNSTVNPVKLYIFVSFVTFFVLAVFPSKKVVETAVRVEGKDAKEFVIENIDSLQKIGQIDSLHSSIVKEKLEDTDGIIIDTDEQKSIEKFEKDYPIFTPFTKKAIEVNNRKLSGEEKKNLFKNNILSAIPKGLFIYMPLFAFVLWIFYNKKKWWYFDHGIYTLHYFSVLLLSVMIITILSRTSDWIHIGIIDFIVGLFNFFLIIYLIFNFYKGANVLYTGSKMVNFIKISIVLMINTIIFSILILGLLAYAFLKM